MHLPPEYPWRDIDVKQPTERQSLVVTEDVFSFFTSVHCLRSWLALPPGGVVLQPPLKQQRSRSETRQQQPDGREDALEIKEGK